MVKFDLGSEPERARADQPYGGSDKSRSSFITFSRTRLQKQIIKKPRETIKFPGAKDRATLQFRPGVLFSNVFSHRR